MEVSLRISKQLSAGKTSEGSLVRGVRGQWENKRLNLVRGIIVFDMSGAQEY